jgi:hypothetical protein
VTAKKNKTGKRAVRTYPSLQSVRLQPTHDVVLALTSSALATFPDRL